MVNLVVSDSLLHFGLWPIRLLCPWDFPGKNTGVGCHVLLQGIFLTQVLNPRLLLSSAFFITSATWEAQKCSIFLHVENKVIIVYAIWRKCLTNKYHFFLAA